MKKFLVLMVVILLTSGLYARKPLKNRKHNVNKVLKNLVAEPQFRTAGFGFLAVDINTGEVISEHNPDLALRLASNLKLVSTATALELLSSEFRFMTVLQYSGVVDTIRHILQGNIIIKGGGDPTLGSKYFEATKSKQFLKQWENAVHGLGIDSVTGAVIADAGFFSREMILEVWFSSS